MSRWIVADDHDPSIKYTGDWLPVSGTYNLSKADISVQNAIGFSGHRLTSNGTLTFPFNGTDIAVFGVSSALGNTTAGNKFSVECFVDGTSIGGWNAFGAFPWTSYCNQTGLSEGQYTVTANITADPANPFWLDFIRYTPAPGVSLANKTLMIDSTDPAIEYSSAAKWSAVGTANITNTTALPAAKVKFNGTSLTWFGLSTNALARTTRQNIEQNRYPILSLRGPLDGSPVGIGFPPSIGADFSHNKVQIVPSANFPPGEHVFSVGYDPSEASPEPPTLDFLLIDVGPLATANPTSGALTLVKPANVPSVTAMAL